MLQLLLEVWVFSESLARSRLTSTLEEDHDVCSPAINLFEVQWNNIAVDLECLSNGGVHLSLRQIWGVLGDPVEISSFFV